MINHPVVEVKFKTNSRSCGISNVYVFSFLNFLFIIIIYLKIHLCFVWWTFSNSLP